MMSLIKLDQQPERKLGHPVVRCEMILAKQGL